MKRYFKIILVVVAILLLLFSIVYLWSSHDYDLVDISEVSTDEGYIDITYDKEENIWNDDVLGILSIEKIGLKATVKEGSKSDTLEEYIGNPIFMDRTSLQFVGQIIIYLLYHEIHDL